MPGLPASGALCPFHQGSPNPHFGSCGIKSSNGAKFLLIVCRWAGAMWSVGKSFEVWFPDSWWLLFVETASESLFV